MKYLVVDSEQQVFYTLKAAVAAAKKGADKELTWNIYEAVQVGSVTLLPAWTEKNENRS